MQTQGINIIWIRIANMSYGGVTCNKEIDVICQHTAEGKLIPLRIRLQDEDGVFQVYKVRGYKDQSHKGDYTMPNGVFATSAIFPFECKIAVFGREKIINIFYNSNDNIWRLVQR